MTRIQSFRSNSTKKSGDITQTAEHFQISSTNFDAIPTDVNRINIEKSVKSTSVPSVVQSCSPDLVSKQHLVDNSDNQHSIASSQTGATKVIFVFTMR